MKAGLSNLDSFYLTIIDSDISTFGRFGKLLNYPQSESIRLRLESVGMMIKMTSRVLLGLALALPTISLSGCGGSSEVEIPENPTPTSPGRPSGVGMGGGEGDGQPEGPPPAEAPPL